MQKKPKFLTPINAAGYPFIIIALVVTIIAAFAGSQLFFILSLVATLYIVYFFRDPNRVPPCGQSNIIAPADGFVQMIVKAKPPEELGDLPEMTRISIFLNVFDVHVNRVPADGTILETHYREGTFVNASLDKASSDNERQSILMETEGKKQIAFVQIAGLVARRILCDLEKGQKVTGGDRFGIIRFGSRVDVYLPEGTEPIVKVGQRTVGGETSLAKL